MKNDDVLDSKEIPVEEQEKIRDKIIDDIDSTKLKFYENLRKKIMGWTKEQLGSLVENWVNMFSCYRIFSFWFVV